MLAFADGAVLFARALAFRFVARGAENGTGHDGLPCKLYLSNTACGKATLCQKFGVGNPSLRVQMTVVISFVLEGALL